MRLFLLTAALIILAPATARAIEATEMSEETFTQEYIIQNIPDFVTTPKNGLDWTELSKTQIIVYEEEQDGLTNEGNRPKFPGSVAALDGTDVIMQGYMFPLEETDAQSQFLFGPFPASCPFHYHVGPNLVIEAHAKKPIDFVSDAITLKGRLELVPRDDEFNVFYRLKDVELVP